MGEECFNSSKRRKIEDTVFHILEASDLETVTEFGVRFAAAERLGFELSGLNNRLFIRQLVDSFLLSTAAEILRQNSVMRIDGEECFNESKRRKIEDTVLDILKAPDVETVTEFGVRSAAAERLGFELSGLNSRLFIRQLVDSFLLSTAAEVLRNNSLIRITDDDSTGKSAEQRRRRQQHSGIDGEANYDGKIICKLSNKRRVTIHDYRGSTMVSIHEFDIQDGNLVPVKGTHSGISLTSTQWSSFRNSIPSIEDAILKLDSQLSSEAVTVQIGANITNSAADSASEKRQTETGVSNLTTVINHPGKKTQSQSEPDARSSADDSAVEKGPKQNVQPHINIVQKEVDTSETATASISRDHVLAEKVQEAPSTYGTTATSSHQEQIPPTEPVSENFTLVPPLPNQLDRVALHSPKKLIPTRSEQTSIGHSSLLPSFPSQGHPHPTLPIQPPRFEGRNYHSWRNQMEMLLNQLNIAYVLSELSPQGNLEDNIRAKAGIQRWITDDYLCRQNILNSLCDSLFQLCSAKSFSARELWEELKAAYNNDYGTKRSDINNYIHFQMVDGVSVLDQVRQLHNIADSIIASGTWIEEAFHVSVIVSKLPPSWKELRHKLMQEEFLPLNMLMHCLRVEAETNDSRNERVAASKLDPRERTKRDESRRECFGYGKEGHIRKYCPVR